MILKQRFYTTPFLSEKLEFSEIVMEITSSQIVSFQKVNSYGSARDAKK